MLVRLSSFAIAAALLFIALRVHKSSGKHVRISKPTGVVLSFLAGCALLATFVGDWMGNIAGSRGAAGVFVALLIAAVGILVVDWALDGRPDKPAFWAAFALAALIVFGANGLPQAFDQIGDGGSQVTEQLGRVGNGR